MISSVNINDFTNVKKLFEVVSAPSAPHWDSEYPADVAIRVSVWNGILLLEKNFSLLALVYIHAIRDLCLCGLFLEVRIALLAMLNDIWW